MNSKVRQINLNEGITSATSCVDYHRNHVAIGTADGKIVIFDTSRLQILTTLEGTGNNALDSAKETLPSFRPLISCDWSQVLK